MTRLIKRYVYRGNEVEEIVETRMRQYNKIKVKITEVILRDPNSLTQDIKRANIQAYYWLHCITKNMHKCDPCLSGWKREDETRTLIPL